MTEHMHRALIVDDYDDTADHVKDQIESLGHISDRAANQAEARALLAANKYCYVLLDLEIPVKPKRIPEVTHGVNLLESIRRQPESCRTRVIIMTSHGTKEPYLAVDLMQKGADDYIGKPFETAPNGRTLAAVIKRALARGCKRDKGMCPMRADGGTEPLATPPAQSAGLAPFRGGKLIFHSDRVELLGQVILRGKGARFSRRVLELLATPKPNGGMPAYSANALAEKLGSGRSKGQNDVAGYVKHLRGNIAQALGRVGVSCGNQDVIGSGGPGYRLDTRVEVEFQVGGEGPTSGKPMATFTGRTR